MFGLNPSTIKSISAYYNISAVVVARIILAALVWAVFAFVGLALDRMMDYLVNATEMPEYLRSVMEPMAFGVPFLLGIAIFITNVIDIIKFVVISAGQPYNSDQGDNDEQDN